MTQLRAHTPLRLPCLNCGKVGCPWPLSWVVCNGCGGVINPCGPAPMMVPKPSEDDPTRLVPMHRLCGGIVFENVRRRVEEDSAVGGLP